MTPDDPRIRLVNHLDGVAAYNDKYFQWVGHGPDEVRAHQREAQELIERFIAEIGDQAFSANLLLRLRSGAGSTDWSGDISTQARAELLEARKEQP